MSPWTRWWSSFNRAWLASGLLLLSAAVHAAGPQPLDGRTRVLLKETLREGAAARNPYAAEVWLVDMSSRLARFMPDPAKRLPLLKAVYDQAYRYHLDPGLVLAVIQVESGFRRFALSTAGAQGLMQVMPFWKKELKQPRANLFDPATNIRYGCLILETYLKREHGAVQYALARYNGSAGDYHYHQRVIHAWHYWQADIPWQTDTDNNG